jgi:hypothetical protein
LGVLVASAVSVVCCTVSVRAVKVGATVLEPIDEAELHITGCDSGQRGSLGKKHISVELFDFQ